MRVTPTPSNRPPTLAVVAALLTVYVVWGSTYFAIAVMIQTLPPLLAAGIRYGTAGALMLGFLWLRQRLRGPNGEPAERATGRQWRAAAIVGTLLLLGGNGGVVLSELLIPSGVAAVIVATVPIWLALFDSLLTRRRPSALAIGGIVAGLVGVAILLVPVEGLEAIDPIGVILVLFAALSWSIGSVYARRAPLPRSGLLGTGMEMVAGGASLVIAGTLIGEIGRTDPSRFSVESLVAVAYLIVFGSILAFTAYTWLLANVPVSTVGTYAYVNPIVAVALGAVFLSEPITLRTVLASVIIIGAVVAMVSGRPREARPAEAAEPAEPAPEASPARRAIEPTARPSVQTDR
jgi:drug/metabolite transporter (DMT)-like permease